MKRLCLFTSQICFLSSREAFLCIFMIAGMILTGCDVLTRGDLMETMEQPSDENAEPIANAGPDINATTLSTVVLDGSGSVDPDSWPLPLTYNWIFTGTPVGSILMSGDIADSTTAAPSFTTDVDGPYTLELTVTDGAATDTDTVVVSASTPNIAPVADAGMDVTVTKGTIAGLDGSASLDPDGGPSPLTFAWTFIGLPAGTAVTDASITGINTGTPSFTPDVAGNYSLELTVNDGAAPSLPDTVIVTAVNTPPTAAVNPNFSVMVNTAAALDGSGSTDPNGDPLTYSWALVSTPPGSALTTASIANNTSVNASLVPDVSGNFIVELTVFDGDDTATASVTIAATPVELVGQWMFNGNANDDSGLGNHGVPGPGVAFVDDRIGNALSACQFDGSADAYIRCGNDASLGFTDLISVSLWARPDVFAGQRLISKRNNTSDGGWELSISTGGEIWFVRHGTMIGSGPMPGVAVGDWVHIAATWDTIAPSDHLRLYCNGVEVAAVNAPTPMDPSAWEFTMGQPAYAAVFIYQGVLDDVRFYHGILSPTDVTDLFNE